MDALEKRKREYIDEALGQFNNRPIEYPYYMFPVWLAYRDEFSEYKRWLSKLFVEFCDTAPRTDRINSVARSVYRRKKEEEAPDPRDPKSQIIFITVSPEHSVPFRQFEALVNKFVSRTVFKDSGTLYTFEQSGTTDETMGYHPHFHLVTRKKVNSSPAKYEQFLRDSFKSIKYQSKVDSFPASYYQDKIDYLNGKKWDAKKDPACVINQKWRAEFGLKNIYDIV